MTTAVPYDLTEWANLTMLGVAAVTSFGWFAAFIHITWLAKEQAVAWLARRMNVDLKEARSDG